jgi:pyruvate,water dikinase
MLLETAHRAGRTVGICGQAPSDYPEFAAFLVEHGIDSLSLAPDVLVTARRQVAALEAARQRTAA